ncbi:MAG: MmgE/PrpD family protein [Oscillospiraceae bacterium]
MSIEDRICSFISGFSIDAVPENIIRRGERSFFDTVAAAFSGAGMEQLINTAYALELDISKADGEGYTILGLGRRKLSLSDAVLLNAVSAHSCEYNDLFYCLPGHPSAVLIPVVLGLGEKLHKSGAEVLEAYICGFEVLGRVNRALMPEHHIRGFHSTSTAGIIGAAAAAAKLLRLEGDKLASALSIACTFACGLRGNFGYTVNSLHVGNAAMNGLRAALYAQSGIRANPGLVDMPGGYIDAFWGSLEKFSDELELLGKVSVFEDPGLLLKKYPTCYSTYQAIDAADMLVREEGICPHEIARAECLTSPNHYMSLPSEWPESVYGQRFCIPFCLAWVLNGGKVSAGSFAMPHFNDTQLIELKDKIYYAVDPGQEGETGFGSTKVTVYLKDGRVLSRRAYPEDKERVEGWSDSAFFEKLSACMSGSVKTEQLEALRGDVYRFTELEDIAVWLKNRFETEACK